MELIFENGEIFRKFFFGDKDIQETMAPYF